MSMCSAENGSSNTRRGRNCDGSERRTRRGLMRAVTLSGFVVVLTIALAAWALQNASRANTKTIEAKKNARLANTNAHRADTNAARWEAAQREAAQNATHSAALAARNGALAAKNGALVSRLTGALAAEHDALAAERSQALIATHQTQVATLATQKATHNASDAKRQEQAAVAAGLSEKQARLEAEHLRYVSDMQLAAHAWQENNASMTAALLKAHTPGSPSDSDTQDQRDFAWRYQWGLLHGAVSIRPGVVSTAGAWTPDGSLWTLSAQGERRWNIAGQPLGQTLHWAGMTAPMGSLLAPNGSTLAVRDPDGRLALRDPADLHTQHVLELASAPVRAWAFSPDGLWLVVLDTKGVAQVWDTTSGRLAHTTRGFGSKGGFGVALAPSGDTFAVADLLRAEVTLYDAAKPTAGQARQDTVKKYNETVTAVAFSPDGQRLALGDWGGHVIVWDRKTRQALPGFSQATHAYITCLSFSPDSGTLAVGSREGGVRLWDVAQGVIRRTLVGHTAPVTFIAWRSDGAAMTTGSQDDTTRLWPAAPLADAHTLPVSVEDWSHSIFSPDGRLLAVINVNGQVALLDMRRRQALQQFRVASGQPTRLAFTPDGKTLAVGTTDMNVYLWDIHARRMRRKFVGLPTATQDGRAVAALEVSHDGRTMAAGVGLPMNYSNRKWRGVAVCVWDLPTGHLVVTLPGYDSLVSAVAFSPDDRTLATSEQDNRVRVWRVGAWKQPALTFAGPDTADNRSALALAFSPDGRQLAVGGFSGDIGLYNAQTGLLRGRLTGHTDAVREVCFTPDGRLLVSASYDDTVKLWDVIAAREVRTFSHHTNHVMSAVFSPSGNTLVTSGWDALYVWQAPPSSDFAARSGIGHPKAPSQAWVGVDAAALRSDKGEWLSLLRERVRYIPPRPAGATPAQIDLSRLYNATLDISWDNPTNPRGPDFSDLPDGLQTLAGTRWDIRGLIQLGGSGPLDAGVDFPKQVNIPIQSRCRQLAFLHASIWSGNPSARVGTYVIHYADGSRTEAPSALRGQYWRNLEQRCHHPRRRRSPG